MGSSVRTIYIQLRASAEALSADIAATNSKLDRIGESGKQAGRQISDGMTKAHESMARVALNAGEAALAFDRVIGSMAKYTAIAAASGSTTENLVNSYRALRIALSPTPFTVGAVATGVLVEQTVKLTNARAKLIEQQALMAATSGRSISGIDAIHGAAAVSGSDEATLQKLIGAVADARKNSPAGFSSGMSTLGTTSGEFDAMQWVDALGLVANKFDALKDPVDRATLAVQLFGKEHAGEAIRELTPEFANAAAAASEFGATLNSTARQQIYAMRHDILDLKSALLDFSKEKTWVETIKTYTAEIAAAYYDMSKRGVSAIGRLIDKQTGLGGVGVSDETEDIGAPARERQGSINAGLTADDLTAQSQSAAQRQSQTYAGRLKALQAAREQEGDTYAALLQDQQEHQLTSDQRLVLVVRQQSAAALAGSMSDQLRGMRQAPGVVTNQLAKSQDESGAQRQGVETAISLARLSAQAQIDAIQDVHERAIQEADADVQTAKDRLAKLKPIYAEELATRIGLIQKRASLEASMEGPDESGNAQIAAEREIEEARSETASKLTALDTAVNTAQIRSGNALISATRGWTEEFQQDWFHAYEAIQKKAHETFLEQNLPDAYRGQASQRVGEINARGKGVTDELGVQKQKLELERAYGLQTVHTDQERLSYATQLAALDDKARQAKLDGLKAELESAEAHAKAVNGTKEEVEADAKVAELTQQIAQTKAEDANASYAAQTKLIQLQQSQGWGGYLRQMQADAKTASQIAQDGVSSAIDRVSSDLAKLTTDPKHNSPKKLFGDTLKSVGQQISQESYKSLLQRGLGKLGIHGAKKPTGNPGDAIHVIVDNAGGGSNGPAGVDPMGETLGIPNGMGIPGAPGSPGPHASILGSIFKSLGGLFSAGAGGGLGGTGGGGGDGLTESVTSSISFMADGGDVDPGNIYGVAEAGEAELFMPKTSGRMIPASKLGGGDVHYHIDARGSTDPALTAFNVKRAIMAAHADGVATSVQASAERAKRIPR